MFNPVKWIKDIYWRIMFCPRLEKLVDEYHDENLKPEAENRKLTEENERLELENMDLIDERFDLEGDVEELKQEIIRLKGQLEKADKDWWELYSFCSESN